MALDSRTIAHGLIHHSDRGVQYACQDYVQQSADNTITPGMSRIGNRYDTAKAREAASQGFQGEITHFADP